MKNDRRDFFRRIGSMGAGLMVGQKALATQLDHPAQHEAHSHTIQAISSSQPSAKDRESELRSSATPEHPLLIEAPDLPKLPWKMVDGAKEFHLTAEPVRVEFVPGRVVDVWGYNGSMPGPTLEANEGDRIRVIFENRLPEMTSIHWPAGNAGSQPQRHTEGTHGDVMYPLDDPIKKQVPGYPQDMRMNMEEWVPQKPEFYGLRPTWDRAMMGMMTLVRILPPDLFDKIMELKGKESREEKPVSPKPAHKHPHKP